MCVGVCVCIEGGTLFFHLSITLVYFPIFKEKYRSLTITLCFLSLRFHFMFNLFFHYFSAMAICHSIRARIWLFHCAFVTVYFVIIAICIWRRVFVLVFLYGKESLFGPPIRTTNSNRNNKLPPVSKRRVLH